MIRSHNFRAGVKTAHHVSGLVLAVFIAVHLVNHLFALAGPEKHIEIMSALRSVYRHPLAETVLLSATVFQVVTGLRLLYSRKAQTTAEKIQVWSGLYLAFFLVIHVSAVLMGRYVEQLDTNFYYAAAGLNLWPARLFFIPYYLSAVAAIGLHLGALHYRLTGSAPVSYGIGLTGLVLAVLIVAGFTDFFHWREIPEAYQDFIRRYFG